MKENSKGIHFGALWGMLIWAGYTYLFIGVGIIFIWKTSIPNTFWGWTNILGSSILYIIAGAAGFIPVFFIILYFVLRDRSLIETFGKIWPLLLVLIYPFLPNFPGPVDEIIVGGIGICLQIWFLTQKETIKKGIMHEDSG